MHPATLIKISAITFSAAAIALCITTFMNMEDVPSSLKKYTEIADSEPLLLDRDGSRLNISYSSGWNLYDNVKLHEIPQKLKEIIILSEDRRFYSHAGADWAARIHAIFQNIEAGRAVRGASTISEQVVRMIHPRKRTIFSRWLEGFEAHQLENRVTKDEILEFYLNQVPYASNRRGVKQASRFYFDRTLDTLDLKEMAALAILIRAPSSYNLYTDLNKNSNKLNAYINRLAEKAIKEKIFSKTEWYMSGKSSFSLHKPELSVYAPHFIRQVYDDPAYYHIPDCRYVKTTLDGALQLKFQEILSSSLDNLNMMKVSSGGLLVADNKNGEILAWVSEEHPVKSKSGYRKREYSETYASAANVNITKEEGSHIDAVKTLRQPGSAMKPFLYALALDMGWSAVTIIDDSPLQEPVGLGMHTYHNYSNIHYGPVTLREALGNSLNIPAVKTVRFTGVENYMAKLRELGITSLMQHPDYYGDGLALGNGEVSLYEMVQAYSVLANSGRFVPLTPLHDHRLAEKNRSSEKKDREIIFSEEACSIIGSILSDKDARALEFGTSDLIDFPVQTAIKTGTSSDFRDAWAMGYNRRYTAGVWMGNLDGTTTRGLTGSKGPLFVLKSIFSELERSDSAGKHKALPMSSNLVIKDVKLAKKSGGRRFIRSDWFISGSKDENNFKKSQTGLFPRQEIGRSWETPHMPHFISGQKITDKRGTETFRLITPVNGLEVAMDPRIPDELEYMAFKVSGVPHGKKVRWSVDGVSVGPEIRGLTIGIFNTAPRSLLWNIRKGNHNVGAELVNETNTTIASSRASFIVK